jgi:hypothetical protein
MAIQRDQYGNAVQAAHPASSQTLTIGSGSIQSAPWQSSNSTTYVRVVATGGCWLAFGTNPTAAASGATSIYLPAGVPEYFWVSYGEKIAVIQDTGAGLLNIGELTA